MLSKKLKVEFYILYLYNFFASYRSKPTILNRVTNQAISSQLSCKAS